MKAEIRQRMLSARDALQSRDARSERIMDHLLGWEPLLNARTVFLYASMRSEVRTELLAESLIIQGKTVCFPRMIPKRRGHMEVRSILSRKELVPGAFKTMEPPASSPLILPESIDIALVPGLAFTRTGTRLGYGGGYYDRYLSKTSALRVGMCFFSQIVDLLPQEVYDIKMNKLVCEQGLIFCGEEK